MFQLDVFQLDTDLLPTIIAFDNFQLDSNDFQLFQIEFELDWLMNNCERILPQKKNTNNRVET